MSTLSPYLAGFLAMICYATLIPSAKKLQLDIPPLAFIGITSAIMCVLAACASFYFEKDFFLSKITPKVWVAFGLFSLINLIGYGLYLFAISKIPATQYQLIYLAAPVVTALVAYVLLHEVFKIQYLFGLAFIGIGLFIALRGGAN